MYKYKNVSQGKQTLVTAGNIEPRTVEPGGEVLSSVPLENPNFEFVGEVEQPQSVVGTAQRGPGAVIDAQKVDELPQEGKE